MDYNLTTLPINGHENPNSYVFNGKIMLCSVVILFVVVVVLICFHSCAKLLFRRRRRRRRRAHHLFFVSSSITNTNNNGMLPHQALDLSVLKTIPTFIYSSNTHDKLLECAVCLSEFEDNEKGRVLPKCKHSFHVDCIDMWFSSHSNCPLCRSPVQTDASAYPPVISVEEVVSGSAEPAGSSVEREEGDEVGCSSSSLPPLELVSVLVEMPTVDCRDLDDMGIGSPEKSGFKSPGNRVLTLNRIWSV